MEKSPDAFRTISEVADQLETPAHVLRFWESRFPQIKPVKRAGGRRYYRPTDVALLQGIRKLLHDEGMTIRGVQKILREQGVRHVASLSGTDVSDDLEAFDAALDATDDAPPVAEVVSLHDWQEIAAISTEMAAAARAAPKAPPPAEAAAPDDPEMTTAVDMPRQPDDQPSLFDFGEVPDEGDETAAPAENLMAEAPETDPGPTEDTAAAEPDDSTRAESSGASADAGAAPPAPPPESDPVWLPAILRSLTPEARMASAAALATAQPRLQALQARLEAIRRTRRG
jgi:DNA-binding transcriptional MerR regulator